VAIRRLYPGCPAGRAEAIAAHAALRGSGRVGRSAAARVLDERAVTLAVVASVRHLDTGYDELLMGGVPRADARDSIRDDIDRVLGSWQLAGRRGREQHRSGTARALPPAVDHQRERPRRIAVRVNDRRVSGRRRAAAQLEERQRVSGERDRQCGAQ
jgi:hypothetical protein